MSKAWHFPRNLGKGKISRTITTSFFTVQLSSSNFPAVDVTNTRHIHERERQLSNVYPGACFAANAVRNPSTMRGSRFEKLDVQLTASCSMITH